MTLDWHWTPQGRLSLRLRRVRNGVVSNHSAVLEPDEAESLRAAFSYRPQGHPNQPSGGERR